MISTTPLLGHLAKSGTKTNTPQEGDTRMIVPGVISPTLEIPYPFFSFFGAPQPTITPVNSWMISFQGTFAVTTGVGIINLGPGVWDIIARTNLEEQGAISDPTSNDALVFFANDGTGTTVTLTRITNKQGLSQNQEVRWRQMVTADQTYSFNHNSVAGLGTGLNLFRHLIIAIRLF
jgi:hypothetical protein